MARVTVEDCVDKIPNRFEVVMLAAHRARVIAAGAPALVDRGDEKNPVIALREIAEEKIAPETLREVAIASYQRHVEVDEPEEDDMAARMAEESDAPDADISEEDLRRALLSDVDKPQSGF